MASSSFSLKLPLLFSSSSFSLKLPPLTPSLHFKPITFQSIPTTRHPIPTSCSIQQPTHHENQPQQQYLPPKLKEIITLFQSVSDPRAKYQQLLFYANTLPPLDDEYKTLENKVQGCVSQVWLRAYLRTKEEEQGELVYFEADSDSVMTKGLAALLVLSFSGLPVSDILRVSPDFITSLGLQQNLTQSRNNGFLNMFRLMQRKALLLGMESDPNGRQQQQPQQEQQPHIVSSESSDQNGVESSSVDDGNQGNGNGSASIELGERGKRIKGVLERELKPLEMEIEDISYQHAGHMGVRGNDSGETHFNVKIVSPEFEGKSLVRRHRMVYQLLQSELDSGLHALSIDAKTPEELESDK